MHRYDAMQNPLQIIKVVDSALVNINDRFQIILWNIIILDFLLAFLCHRHILVTIPYYGSA